MKKLLITQLLLLAAVASFGQVKLAADSTAGSNLQSSPSIQWSRNLLYGKPLYYGYDAKTGKTMPFYTAQLINYIFLGKDEAANLYQPKGIYLTSESDPTVPAYAKGLTSFADIRSAADAVYVPYAGATANVNLGGKSLYAGHLSTGSATGDLVTPLIYLGKYGIQSSLRLSADSVNTYGLIRMATIGSYGIRMGGVTGFTNDRKVLFRDKDITVASTTDAVSTFSNDVGYITSSALSGYVPYSGATNDLNTPYSIGIQRALFLKGGSGNIKVTSDSTLTNALKVAANLHVTGNTIIDGSVKVPGIYSNGILRLNGYGTSGTQVFIGNINQNPIKNIPLEVTGSSYLNGNVYINNTIGSILKADNDGSGVRIAEAVAGTDYVTPTTLSANYIPYTGATSSVNLGSNDLNVRYAQLFGLYFKGKNGNDVMLTNDSTYSSSLRIRSGLHVLGNAVLDGFTNSSSYIQAGTYLKQGNVTNSLIKADASGQLVAATAGTDYTTPNSTTYIGTTALSLNRTSAPQTLNGISIDGNASTVTNGIYTTSTYSNPAWITSLAYSKLTGTPNYLSSFINDAGYLNQSSSFNLGTTSIALNRSQNPQTLSGISIDGNAVRWNNQAYNGAEISSVNNWMLGFGSDAQWHPTSSSGLQNFLGLGSAAYTSASSYLLANSISGNAYYIPMFINNNTIGNSHWMQNGYSITPDNNNNQLIFSGNTSLIGSALVLPGSSGTNMDSPTLRFGNSGKSTTTLQSQQSAGTNFGIIAYASDFTSNSMKRYMTMGIDGRVKFGSDNGSTVTYADDGIKMQIEGKVKAIDDIELTSSSETPSGIILKSPDGHRWRLTVSDSGTSNWTLLQ